MACKENYIAIASNESFSGWTKTFTDPRLCAATWTGSSGSLSLLVSPPTTLLAFARYSRDNSFAVLSQDKSFLIAMTAGSIGAKSSRHTGATST